MLEAYRPMIEAALARSQQGLTFDSVRSEVSEGRALLWPGERSVAITNEYHGREFVIWLAGGDMKELFEMETAGTDFAKRHGFTRMVVEDGRAGWGRALLSLGYRSVRQLVKDI